MASSDGPSLPAIDPMFTLSFLGIREKDLPYGGRLKSHSTQGVSPTFPLIGQPDDEASHLFSSLTGTKSADDCVANAASKKIGRNRAHPIHVRGPNFAEHPKDFDVGCSTHEEDAQHREQQSLALGPVHRKCPPCVEKALDTTDLSFWMYTVVPDDKANQEEELYSDADSEELARRAAINKVPEKVMAADDHGQMDEHTKREEFRARVKESLGFVRMRTEMLQDLSLGEASKDESSALAGEGDTSFMSGTSVLVKHARRLAGTLHTEEQAVRLQDLYQWFQNIGKTLGDDALGASSKSSLHNQLDSLRSLKVVKDLYEATEERKPVTPTSSPYELLRQVQHDVRDRLANLYQGKNFILSHQADTWANEKSESQASDNKENAYELLGTTILESLKEVERMEEDFHVLQSELLTSGCPLLTISHKKKSRKASHKGKKKGASSDGDGVDSGSSPSESSSAPSSSRPTNAQAEETNGGKNGLSVSELPSNRKIAAAEKNIEADGKADNKIASKTKKKNSSQKNEKKKGVKPEGKINGEKTDNNNRPSSASEEASAPLQTSSPSALSPVAEAAPLNVATKEEKGQVSTSATGIGPNDSTVLSQGIVSSTPAVIEDVQHTQEGAKPPSCDAKGQVVDARPGSSSELPRSSKGEGDLLGVQKEPILPKNSLNVQDGKDVKPSDSASLQLLPKPKRKSRRLSSEKSKDEIVQTDDVAILSLEDCNVDALQVREYQAADVKDLLENMRKMQKQLQFWRTKNWAEKHTGQGHMIQPPVSAFASQSIKVDASPDMGMVCYYNPRTGFHMMKNVSDMETSLQQSIMSLVVGPAGHGSPAH